MKTIRYILFSTALVFNQSSFASPSFDAAALEQLILSNIAKENLTRGSCDFSIGQITQTNLNAGGQATTISTPGLYCVAPNLNSTTPNTVTGAVTVSAATGITIGVSNVILDFNGTVLQGTGASYGVVITPGVSNVIIRNGTITSMVTAGISMSNMQGLTTGPIFIDSMTFLRNTTGINMVNPTSLIINNSQIYFSVGNGININMATNCLINNCIGNSNNSSAFVVSNSDSVTFLNCQANDNTTGFLFNGMEAGQCLGCTANENTTGFMSLHSNQQSKDNSFINCFASQNTTGFTMTINQSTFQNCQAFANNNGFQINGNNNSVENCITSENTVNGFQIAGTNISLTNCQASDNGSQGFILNGSNHILLNSLALNNSTGILLALASSLGTICSTCQIRNNTATNNTTGLNNQGTDNRIYSNFANNNTTDYVNVPNVAISPTATDAINFTANIAE